MVLLLLWVCLTRLDHLLVFMKTALEAGLS